MVKRTLFSARLAILGGVLMALGSSLLLGSVLFGVLAESPRPQAALQVCTEGCTYTTVQAALDAAASGDVVQVATGVYTDATTINGVMQIGYIDKDITLRGGYSDDFAAWDPAVYTTTLDAQGVGRVLLITGTHTVQLEGLRLTNGRAIYKAGMGCSYSGTPPNPAGGALYIRGATVTISGTQVLTSAAGTRTNEQGCGGGIYAQDASLTLLHSLIQGNVGSKDNGHYSVGGGVLAGGGSVYIEDTQFRDNWGSISYGASDAGGLYAFNNTTLVLRNNLFEHNHATDGGGAILVGTPDSVLVSHNRFISNTAGYSGGGMYVAGGTYEDNLFRDNYAATYGGGLTLRPGTNRLINNVFLDNRAVYQSSAVDMNRSASSAVVAQFSHNTLNRNVGAATTMQVCSGCSLVMTNTILAGGGSSIAIKNNGGTAKLDYTLFEGNAANTQGTVVSTHEITGSAAFAADGYHLTAASAAVDAGVATAVDDDIDGDFRPRGAGPDVGADESPYSGEVTAPGIRLEKLASQPRWVARPMEEGGSYLQQSYYLRFEYGLGGVTPPVQVFTVTDHLPVSLTLASESHEERVEFAQEDSTLAWRSNEPLLPGEWTWMQLDTRHSASAGVYLRNEAEAQYSVEAGVTQIVTAAVETTTPVLPPVILSPENGEMCGGIIDVMGMAQPGVEVDLWEGASYAASATVGPDGVFTATFLSEDIGVLTTTLTARATANGETSGLSRPVTLTPAEGLWCPQRSVLMHHGQNGAETPFRFRAPSGYISSSDWDLTGRAGNYTFYLYACNCPGTPMPPEEVRVSIGGVTYADPDGPADDNLWEFSVSSAFGKGMDAYVEGRCEGSPDWHRRGGKVTLIDPDGYVLDVTRGLDVGDPSLTALTGVTVTAYVSMPELGGWLPWPAHLYGQTNPQSTTPAYADGVGTSGYYAFFTPPGYYYLQADGLADYQTWRSPVVQVITDIVHVNIPLTPWEDPRTTRVTLLPDGPSPYSVTVPVGGVVEWATGLEAGATITDVSRLSENPVARPLSARNPLSDTLGFDGGMMGPGQVYRRQFTEAGVYSYIDGAGHTGEVWVEHRVHMPVLRGTP